MTYDVTMTRFNQIMTISKLFIKRHFVLLIIGPWAHGPINGWAYSQKTPVALDEFEDE